MARIFGKRESALKKDLYQIAEDVVSSEVYRNEERVRRACLFCSEWGVLADLSGGMGSSGRLGVGRK